VNQLQPITENPFYPPSSIRKSNRLSVNVSAVIADNDGKLDLALLHVTISASTRRFNTNMLGAASKDECARDAIAIVTACATTEFADSDDLIELFNAKDAFEGRATFFISTPLGRCLTLLEIMRTAELVKLILMASTSDAENSRARTRSRSKLHQLDDSLTF
jgi:hypothetical protein